MSKIKLTITFKIKQAGELNVCREIINFILKTLLKTKTVNYEKTFFFVTFNLYTRKMIKIQFIILVFFLC